METINLSDGSKVMKRKLSQEHSDEKNSEKKRKKKDVVGGSGTGVRPKNCPLSERQQLALLMQMTAEESNDQANTPPPLVRKTPGSSGRKDKVHKRNERGETPLHLATIRGDLNAIVELIKQGADINVQDYAGWTPLHEACNHGYHDIAKYLLESGANVNSKGFENDYPLHDAVSNNHRALVGLLLKHGANPLLPNKHGERPMDLSESDVITKMMQQEVISSDESDSSQKTTSSRNKDCDRLKWRGRSESESDHSMKSNKHFTNTASRELFKSEKVLKKRTKTIVSSSFESDDSDDAPLIRQSRLSPQKHFSSSSSGNYDITNKRSYSHSDNKSRRKIKKKKSLFSTSTSGDSSSDTEKIIKKVGKTSNSKSLLTHHSHSDSSDEEQLPLSQVLKSKKPRVPVTPVPAKPANKLSATAKPSETDVYDLTDDFSNESDAISLKPDSGRMFEKWQSPSKVSGIKSPSLFPRKLSVGGSTVKSIEKKTFKPSKDVDGLKSTEKSPDVKTALIRPATPPVKYQTSEMLFDELFKKDERLEQRIKTTSITTSVVVTTATNSLFSSVARIVSPLSNITASTVAQSSATTTSSQLAATFTHTTISCVEEEKSSSLETLKVKSSAKVDESKKKRKSTDCETVKVEEKPKLLSTSVKKGVQATVRSISLDTSNTTQTDKLKSTDKVTEMKAVKKLQLDSKEKVAKTLSEPSKCVQKSASKVLEAKKSAPKPVVKKEVKPEQKKVSLLSDSAFIGDIDSIARKRLQERKLQVKRMKQLQKKRELNPGTKTDEKKPTKRNDVPVAPSPGETPDKQKAQKLQHQKSIKKEAIETLHTAQIESESVTTQVMTNVVPEPVVTQPVNVVSSLTTDESLPETKPILPIVTIAEIHDSATAATTPLLNTSTVSPEQPIDASCDKDEPVEVSDDLVNTLNTESKKDVDAVCVKQDIDAEDKMMQEDNTETLVEKISESQKLLQEYIQQRLSTATICFESNEPKRLPEYIPMSKLLKAAKNPTNDHLNSYEERAVIQKLAYEKRKRLANIIPQAPQYYWEYMTFTGGYLLSGRKESHLSVPVLAPPPHLCETMVELFNAHEEQRVRLRVQHAIEREKLIISCEQEIMREHCRAARTIQNQQVPYSACSVLMDNEVYNLPRSSNENETGKPSIRDRFNARLFISWLQDVDDKYEKMKSALLTRQKHEGETMYAMQKTEWTLKLQELDHSQKGMTSSEINDLHVPMVNIADDFDLLPA